jgi:hypothetical protein
MYNVAYLSPGCRAGLSVSCSHAATFWHRSLRSLRILNSNLAYSSDKGINISLSRRIEFI